MHCGVVQGLTLGTLAACVLFAAYYGTHTSPVRALIGGDALQANRHRNRSAAAALALPDVGGRVQLVQLQARRSGRALFVFTRPARSLTSTA